jgi:Na+:H+ antiporter, NhaA family
MDTIGSHRPLTLAIVVGLVVGKPAGFVLFSALAVALRLAIKPDGYSWLQLVGAGALAGIGFIMSLFIAGQAFSAEADFSAAKIAVFVASVLSAIAGVTVLWIAGRSPHPYRSA